MALTLNGAAILLVIDPLGSSLAGQMLPEARIKAARGVWL
jgi:hypothetical protein